jgi:TP901 family phage tail tape measure protein
MPNLTSQLIVKLIDGVSAPARAAARSLEVLKKGATWAGAGMQTWADPKAIRRNVRTIGREVRNLGDTVSGPMALLGALGFKTAFEFEKAGNFLEALGDATSDQRREFEALANTLNAKYPQSLTEIIKTGTELLKAGLNFQQMKGAMEPTLATAILGDMKPSEVAAIISSAINAFQLPKETADQALASTTKIADRMSYAAIKTTADLKDMGEMFKYVAGAAAATGNSIDQVTAIAMAFAQNKVVGSEAGVALRSAIIRLAQGGTKEGKAAMARAGLNFGDYNQGAQKVTTDRVLGGLLAGGIDASGFRKQIDAIVQDPALATAPLKMAAKITALLQENVTKNGSAIDAAELAQNIQDSITAAGSKIDLVKFFTDLKMKVAEGTLTMGDISKILEGRHFARYQALLQSDLAALQKDLEEHAGGYVMDRYKITLQGIVGPVYDLTAALEKLAVVLGRASFSDLAKAITTISNALDGFSKSSPETLKWITWLTVGLAALAPVGFAIGGVVSLIKMLGAAFVALAGGIAALIGAPVWAVAAIIIGVGAAIAAAWIYWDKIKEWAAYIRDLAAAFGQWSADTATKLVEAIKAAAAGLYQAGVDMMSKLWDGLKAGAQAILDWAAGLGTAIKDRITSGLSGIGSTIRGWLPGGGGGGAEGGGTPPGRAAGGPVMGGRAYIVGERGPELFVPGRSGTIVAGGRGGVVMSPTFNFHGQQNAGDIEERVRRVLRDEVRQLFRGIQSDAGVVFA